MIGKVAKCQRGMTGLILRTYKGKEKPLYSGVCLDPGRVGQEWQSNNPEVIGTLDDWVRIRHAEICLVVQTYPRSAIERCDPLFSTSTKRNLLT